MRLSTTILPLALSLSFSAFAGSLGNAVNVTASAPLPNTVQQYPSITMTPTSTFVLWDEETTRAGRMSGNRTMPASVAVDNAVSRSVGTAAIGEQTFAVWLQNDWLYGQLFDANGNRTGAPVYLAMVDSRHTMRLGVAGGSDRYLVAWPLQSRLVASTVDKTGRIVSDAVQISPGTYGRNIETVHIASVGDEYLVVWDTSPDEPWTNWCDLGCPTTDRDVHIAVVNADGTVKANSEQIIARSAGMPDVASNGTNDYLVVWTGAKTGTVQGVHVARGGAVSGSPMTLVAADAWGPRVVWDGKAYDLAYSAPPDQSLRAVRLNAAGNVTEHIGGDTIHTAVWPRQFGIAAMNGEVAVTYVDTDHLVVRYGTVGAAATRLRAVHH